MIMRGTFFRDEFCVAFSILLVRTIDEAHACWTQIEEDHESLMSTAKHVGATDMPQRSRAETKVLSTPEATCSGINFTVFTVCPA